MTDMSESWKCAMCGQKWSVYMNASVVICQVIKAHKIHPGRTCQKVIETDAVSAYPVISQEDITYASWQQEIHEANLMISGWHNCPCDDCNTRQQEAGIKRATFAP